MTTGRLLTARVVADLLGVSTATVLRWTRAGDLPAIRLPSGQIRYRQDQLDEWIGERATGAAITGNDRLGRTETPLSSTIDA
jgi:excisionase family DNA binding protein